MANTVIALKKSATPSAAPVSLSNGELAINFADGKLFYKNVTGQIVSITSGTNSFGTVNANNTLVVADSPGSIFSIIPGNNIIIVGDAVNDKVTIGLADSVGIGTTTPASRLHVASSNNSTLSAPIETSTIGPSYSSSLIIQQLANAANTFSAISFYNTFDIQASIGATYVGTGYGSGGNLFFNTRAPGGGETLSERMRITSAGNVGIGTSTPIQKLDVYGVIRTTSYLSAANYGTVAQGVSGNGKGRYQAYYGSYTAPWANHDVVSLSVNYDAYAGTFDSTGKHAAAIQLAGGDAQSFIRFSTGQESAFATFAERMRIDSTGNVGIGITSATAKLTVANGTSPTSQHNYGTYTDASNYERINLTANSSGHYIIGEKAGTGSARPLYLGANNAIAATIDASGNVGIGTTSPAQKFEISSSVTNNGGENILRITNPASSVSSRVDLVAGNIDNEKPYFAIKTRQNGSPYAQIERVRIDADGNVGIGNTAPAHKLRVEGTVSIAGNTTPSANLTYDLGSPTLYWNNVYSNNIVTNSASFNGNVSVGGTLSVTNNIVVNKNLDITSKNVVGLTSLESTVLTTFHVGDYKGGKFTIMAKRGTDTHMAEVMVTHNIETAFYNEYSVMYSNISLFNVSADISGSNVRLLAIASTPSDIQFQVMENKFAVDLDIYDRAGTLLLDRSGSVIDERRITREISFGLDFINNSYGLVT